MPGARRDPFDLLARYVAAFIYQDGGFETVFETAERHLCEALRSGEIRSVEEGFEYMLIGVARGLAGFDDQELRAILSRLDTEEGRLAEYVAEEVARRAHRMIREQSPKFYRNALAYIRRRCSLG